MIHVTSGTVIGQITTNCLKRGLPEMNLDPQLYIISHEASTELLFLDAKWRIFGDCVT